MVISHGCQLYLQPAFDKRWLIFLQDMLQRFCQVVGTNPLFKLDHPYHKNIRPVISPVAALEILVGIHGQIDLVGGGGKIRYGVDRQAFEHSRNDKLVFAPVSGRLYGNDLIYHIGPTKEFLSEFFRHDGGQIVAKSPGRIAI